MNIDLRKETETTTKTIIKIIVVEMNIDLRKETETISLFSFVKNLLMK